MNISQERTCPESSRAGAPQWPLEKQWPSEKQWPAEKPRDGQARAALGAHLAQAYADGQRAWPQLLLPFESFRAHCERVLGEAAPAGWHNFGADLYLCCACAEGSAAAHRTLRKELLTRVEAALRRAHSDEELVAESLHALEIKLLVGPRAKIACYAARGPLLGWLHMAARRAVLDQITRFRARKPWLDSVFAVEEPRHHQPDPVLGILHTRYAASLLAAVETALAGLSHEELELMRQAHLEGATIETLGEAYAIHRSTAARRLQRVRQQMADAVRRELSRAFLLSDAEFDEIAAALREHLAPALSGLLTDPSRWASAADVARMDHGPPHRVSQATRSDGQSVDGGEGEVSRKKARVSCRAARARALARRLQ